MATVQANTPDDEPLDPAVERVRARLARLMFVSIGTLLLGVLGILFAVIYRASGDDASAVATGAREFALVPGARIRSVSEGPSGLAVLIDLPGGGTEVVIVDLATASPTLRLQFVDPAGATSE